jgi:hypothetical protein
MSVIVWCHLCEHPLIWRDGWHHVTPRLDALHPATPGPWAPLCLSEEIVCP